MDRLKINGLNITLLLLNKDYLAAWVEDKTLSEKRLGVVIDAEEIKGGLLAAFTSKIENLTQNPGEDIWYSYFAIIYQDRVVGAIGPKGILDGGTAIEIGYGLLEKYWKKGIATQAIQTLCAWYFENTQVKRILAQTDRNNISSQRCLSKNGFHQIDENNGLITWELKKECQ